MIGLGRFALAVGLAAAASWAYAGGEVRALLFHSEGCDHCRAVMEEVLPQVQASFPLEVRRIEVGEPEGLGTLTAFQRAHGRPVGDVPALAVGGLLLQGEKEIRDGLLGAVLELAARGGSDWPVPPPSGPALELGGGDAAGLLLPAPGAADACGPGKVKSDDCRPAAGSASGPGKTPAGTSPERR